MNNVLIVSAWGRGSALAHQLRKQNYLVTFVDMSPCLSLCSSEREGPFGILVPEDLSDLYKQMLCGDSSFSVPQGFSCFTSEGPIESQGNFSILPKSKQQFLWSLAQKWTNSYTSDSSIEWDICRGKYFLREHSTMYLNELRAFLESTGVQWISLDTAKEIIIKKDYVEMEDVSKESLLVWALGGLESRELFPKYFDLLFPDWSEPDYIWRRFSLKWNLEKFQNTLPSLLVVSEDIKESFELQEGMMSIRKHPFSSKTDIWILCSYPQSTDKPYASHLISSAEDKINSLFPFAPVEVSFDGENKHNYFIVYKKDMMRKKMEFKKTLPVLHLNPESCGKLDSYSLLAHSMRIFDFLKKR